MDKGKMSYKNLRNRLLERLTEEEMRRYRTSQGKLRKDLLKTRKGCVGCTLLPIATLLGLLFFWQEKDLKMAFLLVCFLLLVGVGVAMLASLKGYKLDLYKAQIAFVEELLGQRTEES